MATEAVLQGEFSLLPGNEGVFELPGSTPFNTQHSAGPAACLGCQMDFFGTALTGVVNLEAA